jgi:REP element-mobilizing transposase RayT
MARLARAEVFAPDEIAIVHVMNRVVRRCFLLGDDPVTGKNYDHRKQWIEDELERLAAGFGIDLLCFSVMSNHFHLILRSRPDVVETWDGSEVARRWLLICPPRRPKAGRKQHSSDKDLNVIRNDARKLKQIRGRLSDISWWMRLLCQRIAQRANREEQETPGKFWQNRFRAVRLLDEESLLACAAYVDLNPIRAAMVETIEDSQHTSARRRLQSLVIEGSSPEHRHKPLDGMLSPLEIDELRSELGSQPSSSRERCSDKGFLRMSTRAYLELLDWTARQVAQGKPGSTPLDAPPIFERLQIKPLAWCELVSKFGVLFSLVAGRPQCVDSYRSRLRGSRYHLRQSARELLSA